MQVLQRKHVKWILLQKEGHRYKYHYLMKDWQYRYFKLTRSYLLYCEAQHVS